MGHPTTNFFWTSSFSYQLNLFFWDLELRIPSIKPHNAQIGTIDIGISEKPLQADFQLKSSIDHPIIARFKNNSVRPVAIRSSVATDQVDKNPRTVSPGETFEEMIDAPAMLILFDPSGTLPYVSIVTIKR